MDYYEGKMLDFARKRQVDRIKFVENLGRSVLPQQIKRVQANDKTVLKELVLPEWMDWDLLYGWSMRKRVIDNPRECILCNEKAEMGIDYNLKFICEGCFFKIKGM